MKVLVISDIHGSSIATNKLEKLIEDLNPERIFLLGDILRAGYDDGGSEVMRLVRRYSNIVTGVLGNCDYPNDGDDLLVYLPKYASFEWEGHICHLSHKPNDIIAFPPGDIVISGHTHRKMLEVYNGAVYLNPGSTSYPRDDCASYAIMENGRIGLYRIDDRSLIKQIDV
ncbi:MAG: YfcE family phosphodiesterase [Bacilli bacterium]|nr:YfcE family phosphodiesterase [Bacilli bacterium]